MKTQSLIVKLGKKYPKRMQETYDFCGLQCSKLKKETNNILLCLDFDFEVFDYIKSNNLLDKIDLIVTHHPFIFGKKADVFKKDIKKKELFDLMMDKNIPIFSFHTNFDNAIDGMNDTIASILELEDVKPLMSLPMARGGRLKKSMNVEEFSRYAKNKLNVDYGLLINEGKKDIESVALIGGGGWSGFKNALDEGYDIYISGDMPHHARRDVVTYKYNYLDLPHEIEKVFMGKMKNVLLSIDKDLNIIIVDHEKCPKLVI